MHGSPSDSTLTHSPLPLRRAANHLQSTEFNLDEAPMDSYPGASQRLSLLLTVIRLADQFQADNVMKASVFEVVGNDASDIEIMHEKR